MGKPGDDPGRERGVYMISVAAELAGMHPQTLRIYETRGLITPERSTGNTRLYSAEDVERLRRIQGLTSELGLNLAGVERVLELEAELDSARRRLSALERRAERARVDLERELEELRLTAEAAESRRGSRTDLVLYEERGRELVPVGPLLRRSAR